MKASDALGVILAAGKGTRMVPFSDRYPKPILPIAGKPLMAYQLEALYAAGIRDVVIVIGHLGYEVVRALGDGAQYGMKFKYVEQGATLGIAHAVSRLEKHVDRPFFLFLGDIFFETKRLDAMAKALLPGKCDGVLAVKTEKDLEAIKRNYVVLLGKKKDVVRVIEKPRHPRTNLKGCGLYLFDVTFFDAVRRTPRTAMRDEYEITDAIQIFIDDGYRVRALEIVQEDLNLTFAHDLLSLNLHVLRTHSGLRLSEGRSLIGRDVKIHRGARVEGSIVMDGAEIATPILVRDSLVFPREVVRRNRDMDRIIVSDGQEIDCRHVVASSDGAGGLEEP
ncbi:MAG: NTP transferase domain-containing protein [Planctomycetes bacterium]|nr:NTP transferase domain-containing protein [Planctomycetota bacterium]